MSWTVKPLRTGLYLISGGGMNSLARFSAQGIVLVDANRPEQYRALRSQLRRAARRTDQPLRALLVTDHEPAHAGDTGAFMRDGVAVVAQEGARSFLSVPGEASTRRAAPLLTFDREYRLHLGAVEVDAFHFGPASAGDSSIVYFPVLKVVAIGDLCPRGLPTPDYAGGGSMLGWADALERLLQLDFETAVPSEGAPIGRAELLELKHRIDGLIARARRLQDEGVESSTFLSKLHPEDFGWRPDWNDDTVASFIDELRGPGGRH